MSEPSAVATQVDSEVKTRLLRAAAQLFAERGYAATSVGEIVAHAGVTKPVLYYYFESKQGIYLEILARAYEEVFGLLERVAGSGGTAHGRLRTYLGELYEIVGRDATYGRLIYSIFYGPAQGAPEFDFATQNRRYAQYIAGIVAEGVASGEFRNGTVEEITTVVLASMESSIVNVICPYGRPSGREGALRLLDLVVEGVRRPPDAC